MAHGFKESDFQHGVFIPFLTAPRPAGLDWILGKPADIDQARWLVPADLLQFLRAGLGCSIRQKTTQKLRTRPYKYIS